MAIGSDLDDAVLCCRKLFDIEALVTTLTSVLKSFSADSPAESLPRRFLDWAAEYLVQAHVVCDEETSSRVDVDAQLVTAILEVLFVGRPDVSPEEMYRAIPVSNLFKPSSAGVSHS